MIRVGPWRRAAPKAQDRVPRRGTTLRSGVKDDVRLSSFLRIMRAEVEGAFLQTGKPGARERRKRKHQGVVYVRAHVCIWRQCNKDPSASLRMTMLGERIGQTWMQNWYRYIEI